MAELRYNNQGGTLGGALTNVGTTITFAAAPNFSTLTGGQTITLVLEPGTANMEIVYLTAYTALATTGTITRAAEDSSHWPAVAHNSGVVWQATPTVNDFNSLAPLASPTFTGTVTIPGATSTGVVAMGANKITGLANGTVSTDAAAFGQIPAALPPNGAAGGDLGSTYPNPQVTATHLASALPVAQGGTGAATLTGLVVGSGTSAMTAVTAPGGAVVGTTDTQVLTNKDVTSGTNTFPTFNQNTTGSAAKWTTARNLAGNSVDGSANVAFANKFIVQGTVDSGLSGPQFLGALGTGLVKNTTTTGVLSIAAAGTDYLSGPLTGDVTTSGNAATLVGTSNVEAIIRANSLNQFVPATGDYSMGDHQLTNVAAMLVTDGTAADGQITVGVNPPLLNAISNTSDTKSAWELGIISSNPTLAFGPGGSTTNPDVTLARTGSAALTVTGATTFSNAATFSSTVTLSSTINKLTLTPPASGSTLTIADGKTLTASNTMTLAAGADSQTWTFPSASGTVAVLNLAAQTFTQPNVFDVSGSSTGTIPLSTIAPTSSAADQTAASFTGTSTGFRTQASIINLAAAGTSNKSALILQAKTSFGNRTIFQFDCNFNNTTDASRTSVVAFNTANNGSFGAGMTITGNALAVAGGFSCNGASTQTAAASGGAAPAGGTGATAGAYDTSAHRDALITLVNNIRTALVNNGIMT